MATVSYCDAADEAKLVGCLPSHRICGGPHSEMYKNNNNMKKRKTCIPHGDDDLKFTEQLSQLEDLFSHWNERQRKKALWKLIETCVPNSDDKWELFRRLEESMKCNPMDYLPPELGLYVFSFLDRKELAKAAQVSTQWKALAYDRTLLLQKIQLGYIYCHSCSALIGKDDDIICRKYRLDYSLAYHMKNMFNVELGTSEKVEFSTGLFNVAPVRCKQCTSDLGVKYLNNLSDNAENESKIGSFLIKKKMLHFPGEPDQALTLACKKCKGDIAKEQNIISWNYKLRGLQAYQFTTLHNVLLGASKAVSYSSGNYTVADTFCINCKELLGVKYIEAADGDNAFKIGTYLIEKPKVKLISLPGPRSSKEQERNKKQQQKKGMLSTLFGFLRK